LFGLLRCQIIEFANEQGNHLALELMKAVEAMYPLALRIVATYFAIIKGRGFRVINQVKLTKHFWTKLSGKANAPLLTKACVGISQLLSMMPEQLVVPPTPGTAVSVVEEKQGEQQEDEKPAIDDADEGDVMQQQAEGGVELEPDWIPSDTQLSTASAKPDMTVKSIYEKLMRDVVAPLPSPRKQKKWHKALIGINNALQTAPNAAVKKFCMNLIVEHIRKFQEHKSRSVIADELENQIQEWKSTSTENTGQWTAITTILNSWLQKR
jgi:hypothetical protein